MGFLLSIAGWLLLSAAVGAAAALAIASGKIRWRDNAQTDRILVSGLIPSH